MNKWSRCLRLLLTLLSIPVLAAGTLAFVWGVFCVLGGPAGRAFSRESWLFGAAFLVGALVLAALFLLLNRWKFGAWLILIVVYEVPVVILWCAGVWVTIIYHFTERPFDLAQMAILAFPLILIAFGAGVLFTVCRAHDRRTDDSTETIKNNNPQTL